MPSLIQVHLRELRRKWRGEDGARTARPAWAIVGPTRSSQAASCFCGKMTKKKKNSHTSIQDRLSIQPHLNPRQLPNKRAHLKQTNVAPKQINRFSLPRP